MIYHEISTSATASPKETQTMIHDILVGGWEHFLFVVVSVCWNNKKTPSVD